MSKNAQRLSQVVSTFGPGTMVDLPTRSVIVGGLELWEMRGDAFTTIPELRLTTRLEQLLKQQGRLEQTKSLSLRTPPVADSRPGRLSSYIVAPVFPAYFVCEHVDTIVVDGKTARRRRLVRWQDLDPRGGRRKFIFDDGKKSDVTPIRFVCACEKGHLQDIDWKWVVHGNKRCEEAMWIEEKGTSADPADMSVVCGCGEELSLQQLFSVGRMGPCRGKRPWLLDQDPDSCDQKLKLLTRTATNTYFPQVYTVISLPTEEDELTRLVDTLSAELANVQTVEHVAAAKQFNPKVAATLGNYADAEIFARLARIREGVNADSGRSPKLSEFDVLQAGARKSARTFPPPSSTRRRLREMPGQIRLPVSICQPSRTSWQCTGCAKCPASTASPVSKLHPHPPMASWKTFSWRCAVHRFRRMPIGSPPSNNSAKAFSSISTRLPLRNGCKRMQPDAVVTSCSKDTGTGASGLRESRRVFPEPHTFCCIACRTR